MPLKITAVRPNSLAERAGIRPGQLLVEMSGHPVRDALDYQFCLHDETLRLVIEDSPGKARTVEIHKAFQADLGIEVPAIRPRRCRNKCIFCFVDQLPPGMRQSLLVKDEDYRLSFLQGSYITLTDLKETEIERILRQRLSPLYVSVHSTDESVRRRLLGRQDIPNIIFMISRLAQGGIQFHCQLVICPGLNDGQSLRRSVQDLGELFPAVQSVAIVPVGLTGHRSGLPQIQSVNSEKARDLIHKAGIWQQTFRKKFGCGLVYLADEIFLMARKKLPPARYYDDFPQIENGVGMVRHFIDQFAQRQSTYPARLPRPKAITLVTGSESAPFLRQVVVKRLSEIENLTVQLAEVPNMFFGGGVSVSGLLTGRDILKTLEKKSFQGTVILPPQCLNAAGLFLDDLRVTDLEKKLGAEVKISDSAQPFRAIEEVWS
jgi:putative radical SAM enzyme (TIGR03279 family)